MSSIFSEISKRGKFYGLLDNYEVLHEDININDNIIEVNAEFITNLSNYSFLKKIVSKLIDKKLLHLEIKCEFDYNLYQIKFFVHPKLVDYFECSGVLYCDNDYNILNHNIELQFNERFKIVQKMFDERIKKNILKQIDGDIKKFKKLIILKEC